MRMPIGDIGCAAGRIAQPRIIPFNRTADEGRSHGSRERTDMIAQVLYSFTFQMDFNANFATIIQQFVVKTAWPVTRADAAKVVDFAAWLKAWWRDAGITLSCFGKCRARVRPGSLNNVTV